MPVLPKYQLKQLFESGDLITQVTMNDLIEATYNPTLVAGANVTITKVESPSGATITISSDGGGISNVTGGTAINVTSIGDARQVALKVDNTQTNLIVNGTNQLTFAGVHVKDEGINVGTYKTINFIGADVLAQDSGQPGQVNVYIPTPVFASHFNTMDGSTSGIVAEAGITRSIVRISSPTTEGSPFKTNGWAGTNQPAYTSANGSVNFVTGGLVTGFSGSASGNATITITLFDADGTTALETYTTPTLYQNGTHVSPSGDISVIISGYAADSSKWKAAVFITVVAGDILASAGRSGGRYNVRAVMNTDSVTDGGGTYTYNQASVFFDTNPSTPAINGSMSIVETTPIVKHISGVEYYINGSTFEVNVTDIDNLNANTQGRAAAAQWNFRVAGNVYGLPTLQLNAWGLSVGTWNGTWTNLYNLLNANFEYTSWPISATNYRFRNSNANGSSTVYDPWNTGNTINSPNQSILIDTWGTTATNLGEDFEDESQRLTRGASSYSSFNSAATLGTSISNQTGSSGPFSDACVVGSYLVRADKFFADNGNSPQLATLIPNLTSYKPNTLGPNPNYSSYSQTPTYHRRFYTSSPLNIANFDMSFTGTWGSSGDAATALANSQLKIYVRRENSIPGGSSGHGGNPLALHGALFNSGAPVNPFNDGASGVDTVGSLIRSAGSGNTVTGTFGPYSCINGFWVEIQIIDSNIKIDSINVTLQFTNGTTESNPV
jgi:hypothetical protein